MSGKIFFNYTFSENGIQLLDKIVMSKKKKKNIVMSKDI